MPKDDPALNAHRRADIAKAERLYRKKLKRKFNPLYANNLGTLLCNKGSFGQGIYWLKKALKALPEDQDALNNLGVCYKRLKHLAEAEKVFRKCIELHPDFAPPLSNLGSLLHETNRNAEGEPFLRRAVQIMPKAPDANWNLSLCLLMQRKWKEGWTRHHWGFSAAERLARPYTKLYPEWRGEKGKRVLVWGEQGIGDEIMFAGCIPDLIRDSKQVFFDCHPRLDNIFRDSFDCQVFGNRKSADLNWTDDLHIDCHIPLGALPKYYRNSDEAFPKQGYLTAKPLPKKKLRVGISWKGGADRTAGFARSFELDKFAPLLLGNFDKKKDIEWISLQYTTCYEEVARFSNKTGVNIVHDENLMENYYETARLVKSCDLVISVITAVVHLAGALDVPCWCLTPKNPPWKFVAGPELPWHPSVTQYHQTSQWDWESVILNVTRDFDKWLLSHPSRRQDMSNTEGVSSKPLPSIGIAAA